MLNKRIIVAIFAASLLPLAVLAANEVSVPQSFTLVLPSDSSEYTVLGGTFDSVTVNNSSFEFVMSAGSSVEITSADKKNFSVSPDQGSTVECQTSLSKIFISKGAGDATETVTVSPSGTCVGSTGGGGSPSLGSGGGGGGGGGGSYTPPPAPTPAPAPAPSPSSAPSAISMVQQQIAAIQARIAGLQGGAPSGTPPAYGVFARAMDPGERSDEVHRLQQMLASDPEVYPDGRVTGYYGPMTRDAVRRFQLKYGVIQNSNDLGNGRVGPKTMAKLNEIFGGSRTMPAPAAPQAGSPASSSAQINAIMRQIQEIQARINSLKGQ